MMGFIKTNDPQKPPEGLADAADILEYLTAAGNKAAQRRLTDLKQFCYHVWSPDNMSDEWKWLRTTHLSPSNDVTHPYPAETTTPGRLGVSGHPLSPAGEEPLYNSFWPETWDNWDDGRTVLSNTTSQRVGMLDFDLDAGFQMDLSREAGDIYSSFNDPNLPLTGVDEVDWAEIGKMFRSKGG